jgi:cell pole-organizing protein PopZ
MADKLKADNEPSIEEILDSIRQIISEDEKEDAPAPAADEPSSQSDIDDIFAVPAAQEPEAEPDDVFELTERVEPEELPVAKTEDPPFVVDLIDETIKDEPEPVVEKVVTQPAPEPKAPVRDMPSDDSILTQAAETAAFSAIADLARKTAIEHNGITIEEIVRTELKPLLRGWLDKNLPAVIERLVREELERVTKRVLED